MIFCVIYYPPRDPHAEQYVDHIISTIDSLLLKYPDAGISIVGDLNNLNIDTILTNDRFVQVVTEPTRGDNVLDKIITNHANLYRRVSILAPIASSDHNCVNWVPENYQKHQNGTRKRTVRPLKESGLRSFGDWLTHHTWEEIANINDPSEKCNSFVNTLQSRLDTYLPTKSIRLHKSDKPWVTAEVKTLVHLRQEAFAGKQLTLWRYLRNKTARTMA